MNWRQTTILSRRWPVITISDWSSLYVRYWINTIFSPSFTARGCLSSHCYASPLRELSPAGRFDSSAHSLRKPLHPTSNANYLLLTFRVKVNMSFSRSNLDLHCCALARPILRPLPNFLIAYSFVISHSRWATEIPSQDSTLGSRYERSSHSYLTAVIRLPLAYQSPAYRLCILFHQWHSDLWPFSCLLSYLFSIAIEHKMVWYFSLRLFAHDTLLMHFILFVYFTYFSKFVYCNINLIFRIFNALF